MRLEPLEDRTLLASISGTVFNDLNANGLLDVGEPGLEGWTVELERLDGGAGQETGTLSDPSGLAESCFGISVAAIEDDILVGASSTGVVYRFDVSTHELLQVFEDPTPDQSHFSWFGFGNSVAPLGGDVLVGDPDEFPAGGEAYLFDALSGELLHTFQNPTPEGIDHFGQAVATAGNKVLIGAYGDTSSGFHVAGAAYLFERDPMTGAWSEPYTLNAPTPAWPENFGRSVAIDGDTILIGAPFAEGGEVEGDGAAYLYRLNSGTGEWDHAGTFLNPNPSGSPYSDNYASSVAIVGNRSLVGTTGAGAYLFDNDSGVLLCEFSGGPVAAAAGNILVADPDARQVRLFDGLTCGLKQTFSNTGGGVFGGSVALVGTSVVVGSDAQRTVQLFDATTNAGTYVTGPDGGYSLSIPMADTYMVRQAPQDGWFQTNPGEGGTYTVIGDEEVAGLDFGNIVNAAPVAGDDMYAMREDAPLVVTAADGLLSNDSDADPDDTLSAVLLRDASHGQLTLNVDGSLNYTPDAGFVGTDTFTYRANDGLENSNTATVTITVDEVFPRTTFVSTDVPIETRDCKAVTSTLTVPENHSYGILDRTFRTFRSTFLTNFQGRVA